jgi:hypothetical protein
MIAQKTQTPAGEAIDSRGAEGDGEVQNDAQNPDQGAGTAEYGPAQQPSSNGARHIETEAEECGG